VSDWGNGLAEIKFDFINNSGFNANYLNLRFDCKLDIRWYPTGLINIQKDDEGNIYLATDGFGYLKVPSR
jgi:hypothetical protein